MFKKIRDRINAFTSRSDYVRDVFTLMLGTVIAQLIPIILSPVISRIYTPDDMALFATYMSVVAILSSFITLKYELAIILPESDKDSISIMALSMIIALLISILTLVLLLLFGVGFLELLTNKKIEDSHWIYIIPFSVFTVAVFSSFNYWQNRKSHYKTLAVSRVSQYAFMTGAQIGFGMALLKSVGLILGEISGRIVATIVLSYQTLKNDLSLLKSITRKDMIVQFKRYRNFPKFTLPADLVNVVTNQIPILAMGKYFQASLLGNYFFMDRILNAPISLLGKSVLDVFKQRASTDYNKFGNCRDIYVKTLKTLTLASIFPTLVSLLFAPWLFRAIFGAEWEIAGHFARIMSLMFFFRLIASPLSYMFFIAEKQHIDMIWQILLFFTTLVSFGTGVYFRSIEICLWSYSISYSVMYLINIYITYNFAKGKQKT